MQTQKSIVEKLVIFDYPFCTVAYYAKYSDGGECWCGFSIIEHTKQFPVKAIYEGVAAIRKLWEIEFDELSNIDKKLIIATFPNILNADKTSAKRPREILERAIARVRFSFGVKCPRCSGEGHYPSRIDDGVCHKCHGSGIVLPRLTDKKLAEIAKRFSGEGK